MARICFFRLGATPLFVPNSEATFGGAEVRALHFARGLAELTSHQVSFAVRAHKDLMARTPEGIEIRPMPGRNRGFLKIANSVRRRFSRKPLPYPHFGKIGADVIACFGVHDPTPSVIASAVKSRVRTILFLTSSEDVNAVVATANAKQRRRELHREFALECADMIVVQTEFQREMLKREFGRESQLIRNPIDTRLPQRTDLKQPRSHVLWVGRADCDSKRADICFSIAASCPEIPFRIVMNDCESELGSRLLASCPPNVTVERHVPLQEIEGRFASASVLINTSVSEGFPNAFLQSAKFATPILSLIVDPDGMLTQHGCGEVAGTAAGLVELIRQYHHGGVSIEAKGIAARNYVVRSHEVTDRVAELDFALNRLGRVHRAA